MKTTLLLSMLLWISPLLAQTTEQRVIQAVEEMMNSTGQVIFSELNNDDRFNAEDKAFLGRLYEIFFQIPTFLKTESEITGKIPTRQLIAAGFGITQKSADLLLAVMQTDPRMPILFELSPETGEIASLDVASIDAFVAQRGATVKVTQWVGESLPQFELTSFQDETIRSQDMAGKNFLVYFWFSGCPPCVRIAPILEQLNHQYSDSNFQVIGFNADRVLELETTDQQRQDYLQDQGLRFVNLHVDRPTRQTFGNINVFPTLFFVDSDGVIFQHIINFQDQEALESIVRELVQAD